MSTMRNLLVTLVATVALLGMHFPSTWADTVPTPGQGCSLNDNVDADCYECVIRLKDEDTCSSTNACQTETCVVASGETFASCTVTEETTCDSPEVCKGATTCDPSSGECNYPDLTTDTRCNATTCDGDFCDSLGPCREIACVNGKCTTRNLEDGTNCNDGNPCNGPEECAAGVCVSTDPDFECPESDDPCQAAVCDQNDGCGFEDLDVGTVCSEPVDGTTCRCTPTGCDLCITDCPTNQNCLNPDKRFCAEAEAKPAQATCGDVTCQILCEDACGEGTYTASDCNNKGGCSCKGATSFYAPNKSFTGPCCQCIACPAASG